MKAYVDITLLPSADIGHHFLWGKVFQKVHTGLVDIQDANDVVPVGIALPEYNLEKHELGSKLRLFAETEELLASFNAPQQLANLTDYVHLTRVREVASNHNTFARYRRQQPKSSKARLARRKAKRQGLTMDDALSQMAGFEEQQIKTPYINIQSTSSAQHFRLFILKEVVDHPINEGFSSYGLSCSSTVPDF